MNVHDQDMYTISAGCTKAALLEQDININELNQANGGKSKITHRRQSQTLLSCELEAHWVRADSQKVYKLNYSASSKYKIAGLSQTWGDQSLRNYT
jgi:hypothetical protein